MQNHNAIKKKKVLNGALLVLAYCILLFPFVCTVICSVPAADDFCKFKGYLNIAELIKQSVMKANNLWLTWSGGWIYMLLQDVLCPVNSIHMLSFFGWEMLAFFLLFIASFFYFSYILLHNLVCIESKNGCLWLTVFLLAMLLCSNIYLEIFYWFVGSSYAWGASFCFLSLAFMMKLESENKKIFYVLALLFGLFACNAINYVVTAGLACLLLNASYFKANRRTNKAYAVMMLLFVIVGVLTVFAPGNFARRNAIDSTGLDFASAFFNTFEFIKIATVEMMKRASVLLLFTAIFVFSAYVQHRGVTIRVNPLQVLLFLAVSLLGTIFPVALGYSGTAVLPNRIKFLICINVVVGFGLLAVWAGGSFGKWLRLDEVKTSQAFAVPAVIIAVMAVVGMKYEIRSTEPFWQTLSGMEAVKAESRDYKCLLNEIKNSPDADVVIEHPYHEPTGILMPPGLEEDPEFWVNKPVAQMYGKNSVSVIDTYIG